VLVNREGYQKSDIKYQRAEIRRQRKEGRQHPDRVGASAGHRDRNTEGTETKKELKEREEITQR